MPPRSPRRSIPVSQRLLSAANPLEASIVIESRKGEAAGRELDFADLSRCDRGRCGRSRSSRDRAHCMAALWQGPPSGRAQLRRLLFLRSCKEPRAAIVVSGGGILSHRHRRDSAAPSARCLSSRVATTACPPAALTLPPRRASEVSPGGSLDDLVGAGEDRWRDCEA